MFDITKNKDIVFIDIEANDYPKRILQFGGIKLKKNNETDKKNWFCNPKCKLSPHILKIVGKNLKKIEKGMSHIRIIEKIYKFLNNTILISYGNFDYNFLNDMSKRFLKKKLNVEYIDLQNEWKKISMSKEVWALNKLASFFKINVDAEELHDAFYDTYLLYQIFCEWRKKETDKIIKNIYKATANNIRTVKIRQNKSNIDALTINNIDDKQGYCFLKTDFNTIVKHDIKTKILSGLDILEVTKTEIKRNWNWKYLIDTKPFDEDTYEKELVEALKKYIISIRNKRILIAESDFHKLIKINNLCAQYLNLFPLNNISFTNGYKNLYSKINISNEKYMSNLDLIKNWKVFLYIHNHFE